jgi:putative phosphoribosyl transferase
MRSIKPPNAANRRTAKKCGNVGREFGERSDAGRLLAKRLTQYAGRSDAIVLALPRGGVPVAYEVACALNLPLEIFTVRKIGVPYHPELAMGAVASDGTYGLNRNVIEELGISNDEFLAAFRVELEEARRRESAYRQGRPAPLLTGKVAILVDDGLATGSTMRVAVDAMHRRGAAKVVVAVPVAPVETRNEFASLVDEFVCILTPEPFHAVGAYYVDFRQIEDAEVRELMNRAGARADVA